MRKPYFIERGAGNYNLSLRSLLNFEGTVRAEILRLSFLCL